MKCEVSGLILIKTVWPFKLIFLIVCNQKFYGCFQATANLSKEKLEEYQAIFSFFDR